MYNHFTVMSSQISHIFKGNQNGKHLYMVHVEIVLPASFFMCSSTCGVNIEKVVLGNTGH